MVRLIVTINLKTTSTQLGFNSKNGSIDSPEQAAELLEKARFNSKNGSIDSVFGTNARVGICFVSIPKMVRLIDAQRRSNQQNCISFQFQKWFD